MRYAAVLLCLTLLCAVRSCLAANVVDLGQSGDTQPICVTTGDTVRIYGTETGSGNALYVDHVPASAPMSVSKDGTLCWFDWTATWVGRHPVTTVHTMPDGTMTIDRRYVVVVTDAPPLTVEGIPASSTQDITARVHSQQTAQFTPVSIQVIMDGSVQILSQPASQDTALLKLQATASGDHAYQLEAVDANGVTYLGPTYTVNIPSRLTVTMAPSYAYAATGDLTPLSVSIAPGVNTASVSYTIDGQAAGTASSAPYAATTDMSQNHTGQHTVVATLTDTTGNTFDSPPFALTFTNKLEDDARAAAAAVIDAAKAGDLARMKQLIAAGADVDTGDRYGDTALMDAADSASVGCLKALIAAGAAVNAKDSARVIAGLDLGGKTALMDAAASGSADCVKALIAAGADVNARDDEANTALFEAAGVDCAKTLIAAGADVNAKDNDGDMALFYAAQDGSVDCIKALIAAGADVNAKDNVQIAAGDDVSGGTALMDAGFKGHADCVEALIAAGADVNARDSNGLTALMAASDSVDCVKALVAAGADVNAETTRGMTALMFAEDADDAGTISVLIEAGATE